MLKIIKHIYQDYQIPPNWQEHMVFTASLGKIICQNWVKEKFNQDLVVTALLLHDIGNIVKFNLEPGAPNLLMDQDKINYWRQVQKKFRKKYGLRADQANLAIIEELRPYPKIKKIMEEHYFEFIPKINEREKDWESKIVFYCDLRFDPAGITSIKDRIKDLQNRYKDRDDTWRDQKKFRSRVNNCLQLEKQLNQLTTIDLEKISQDEIDQLAEKLYNKKIKLDLY